MSKLSRIIWHWTAGGPSVSTTDREHYHYIIDQDTVVYSGDYPPQANISTSDADGYAAHVARLNTGSIGVALCGMFQAREGTPYLGPYPLVQGQFDELYLVTADLCEEYNIPVTKQTVLNHAEVQRTLGVDQAGKWDITWMPGMPTSGDAIEVGDAMRRQVQMVLDKRAEEATKCATVSRTEFNALTARVTALESKHEGY